MSFFLKKKQANGNIQKKRKPKRTQVELKSNNDELTSDEEVAENHDDYSSDENETVQEKKLRLAKLYLEEIEKQEKERIEDNETLMNINENVSQRLKEDHLKLAGKLRLTIADQYIGACTEEIKILKCKQHKQSVTCLCVTIDNCFVFSGSKDGNIIKWSLSEFKKLLCLPYVKKNSVSTRVQGHSHSINCIATSSSNKFLAIGDESNDIQIWNPDNFNHIHTLKGHRSSITGLIFRRDTHTLYSCSKDRSVKVWSLNDMSYVETLFGHQDGITSIDALFRERAITSGGRDVTLRLWKIAEESQLIFNGHLGSIDVVKFINEDNFISGGDDGQLCLWSVIKKKPLCTVKTAHGEDHSNSQPFWITSIATLVNSNLVASGSSDGLIRIWKLGENFRSINLLFTIEVIGFVNSLQFTTDGKYVIGGIGTEHKFGRWSNIKSAKNGVVIIPLLRN